MFLKKAALFVEPPSHHCKTGVTASIFLSHLVRGWFKGYYIWLDSNIVLSPARGWPHMSVLEKGENQEAFPYLIAFLVITYPWQSSALGSHLCAPSTETGPVLCWQQRHQHHRGEKVSCHLSPGKKKPALIWETVYATSFQITVLPFMIIA